MHDVPAFALLAGALLVTALGPTAAVLLLVSVIRRALRRRKASEPVLRRCDECGRSWKAEPGCDLSLVGLRVRRRVRRRARLAGAAVPGWAKAQGWGRCPSCLSVRVRSTGDAITPARWGKAEKAGIAITSMGFLLCLVAALAVAVAT